MTVTIEDCASNAMAEPAGHAFVSSWVRGRHRAFHGLIGEKREIVTPSAHQTRLVPLLSAEGFHGRSVHRVVKRGKSVSTRLLLRKRIRVASTTALDISQICPAVLREAWGGVHG